MASVRKPLQSSLAWPRAPRRGMAKRQPRKAITATGTIIQKPHRQPKASETSPASVGPIDGPIIFVMPKIAITKLCWLRGYVSRSIAWLNGTSGAPAAPWTIRQKMSSLRDVDAPQKNVDAANKKAHQTIVDRRPNLSASQPLIGVTTAVATMLNVIVQDTSSWVAPNAPWSLGSNADEISTDDE